MPTITAEATGDLTVHGAAALQVRSIGSGQARHRDVARLDLPTRK